MKKTIILILKLSLGIGILYWLYQKGSLDFSLFTDFLSRYYYFGACLLIAIIKILLNSYRWQRVINNSQSKKLKYKETLSAEWSSLFFSTVLPGSVSGDIVRIGFLKRNKLDTSFLVLTVLFDRFLGFFGLITMAMISSFLYFRLHPNPSSELTSIAVINLYIFLALISTSLIMFFIKRDLVFRLFQKSKMMTKFFITIFNFFNHKKEFLLQLILSTFAHVLNLLTLWFITILYTQVPVEFYDVFIIAPLGLLSQVLPLTPSGVGVGHAAFDYLYQTLGINNGASIFNVFWLLHLIANLLGFIPYLLRSLKGASRLTR